MLETKNTITEMKNAFNWLICILPMARERVSEFENMSVETLQTEMQREKEFFKKTLTQNIQEL